MLLLLAFGCPTTPSDDSATGSATAPVDLVARLTTPGPYTVGYHADGVTYEPPTGSRTLRLATWYPSEATDGSAVAVGLYQGGETTFLDAPIAAGSFPLAIFSHGHQGYAENSGFLMEHLASHGWIVLAPDHTGDTTFDGGDRTTEIYFQRPLDLSAVLDATPSLAPVGAAWDGGPVLALGHSFGGYTMLAFGGGEYDEAVCPADTSYCSTMTPEWEALFAAGFLDARVGAYVVMAGGDVELFGEAGLQAIERPYLHMTATEDQGPGSEGDTLWAGLHDGDDVGVILEGGGHQSFTDFSDLMEDVPLDAEESFRIVNGYVLAWAERMRGSAEVDGVLDGTTVISEAASLR